MTEAEILQTPIVFEFKGRKLKVAPRTFETHAAFVMWFRRRCIQEIERDRPAMSATMYQQCVEGYRHDVATGALAWGMPTVSAAAISPDGARYLAYLDLAYNNEDIDEAFVEDLYSDAAAWDEFCRLRGEVDRPTTARPAAGER